MSIILLKSLWEEIEDKYKGEHEAPDKESGAPLYDLTRIYPEDIYSSDALRLYGSGNLAIDSMSLSIIRSVKGRPNAAVKIYRAVPKIITPEERLQDLENQQKYILKYGKIPRGINFHTDNSSRYYEFLNSEIEKIKKTLSSTPTQEQKIKINPGDWVTINRQYAADHGRYNLLNKYTILTKTVPAKHLFTTADDLSEYGYDPS